MLTKELNITNPNDSEQSIRVEVFYAVYHQPERRYLSNGDVGYPEETEMEIMDWAIRNKHEEKPEWLTQVIVENEFYNNENW